MSPVGFGGWSKAVNAAAFQVAPKFSGGMPR
jgi:hypothetical protein